MNYTKRDKVSTMKNHLAELPIEGDSAFYFAVKMELIGRYKLKEESQHERKY
jgi:hypothetical protein